MVFLGEKFPASSCNKLHPKKYVRTMLMWLIFLRMTISSTSNVVDLYEYYPPCRLSCPDYNSGASFPQVGGTDVDY